MGQGQNCHNIYAIRPNCGSERFAEFGFKYHRKFKGWNLWEIGTIRANPDTPLHQILWNVGHSFLGERGADDVSGQVFHGPFISGLNSGSAEHVETRMSPLHEYIHQVIGDLAFGKEQREDLVPEDRLQMFQLEQRRRMEYSVSIKTSVGAQHMQVRMPSKEIAKR